MDRRAQFSVGYWIVIVGAAMLLTTLLVTAFTGTAEAGTRTLSDRPFKDVARSDSELWEAAWHVKVEGTFKGYKGSLEAWEPMTRRHVALVLDRYGLGSRPDWESDYRIATRGEVEAAFSDLQWSDTRWSEDVLRSQVVRLIYRGKSGKPPKERTLTGIGGDDPTTPVTTPTTAPPAPPTTVAPPTTAAPTTTTTLAPTTTTTVPAPTTTTTLAPTTTTTTPAPASYTRVLSVRDFGARGDGTSDDTLAVQAALSAVRGGEAVYLPAGTYRVGQLKLQDKQDVTVFGQGAASLLVSADPETVLDVRRSGGLTLADFALRGSYAQTYQRGITLSEVSGATLTGLTLTDLGFAGIFGTFTDTQIREVRIEHCGDFGIQTKPGSARVTVEDSSFSGFASRLYPGHAVYIQDTPDAVVRGNYISGVDDAPGMYEVSGIKITDGSPGALVEANVVEDSFAAVSVPWAYDTVVRNNIGRRLEERGFYVLAGSRNVLFEGNRIEEAPIGFRLLDSSTITLKNNVVTAVQSPVQASSVSGLSQSGNSWQ